MGEQIVGTSQMQANGPLTGINNQAANCANRYAQPYYPLPQTAPGQRIPNIWEQLGTDPTSKLAAAIADHAAAIRELADVLYHIGTED